MIKLSNLKIGEVGKIHFIADDLEVKRRLLDIGFTKDSEISCVLSSPFGGLFAYEIKNTVVALRKADANKIWVEMLG